MAKSKARALAKRTRQHNLRMMARRAAVRELNAIAHHVGATPLPPKQASKQQVQRLIKLLQRRLVDQEQLVRLHAAAERWASHGGDVGGVLVPPPAFCCCRRRRIIPQRQWGEGRSQGPTADESKEQVEGERVRMSTESAAAALSPAHRPAS